MAFVTIGVHFGQRREPTAICVAEIEERQVAGRYVNHFNIRRLERLPIGTPYPEVVDRVTAIVRKVRAEHDATVVLYLDATGLGGPVVDPIHRAPITATVFDVYINHGDRRLVVDQREIRLGKAYLVTRLQVLLQAGRVHLPDTEEARTLAEELMDYEVEVAPDANDRYGAFKVGSRDDLVTALGLALQEDGPERAWIYMGD
jgi:hypothetical protein